MRNRSKRRWTTLLSPKRNQKSRRGRRTNPATKVRVKGTGTVQLLSATPPQERATNAIHCSRRCLRTVREAAARTYHWRGKIARIMVLSTAVVIISSRLTKRILVTSWMGTLIKSIESIDKWRNTRNTRNTNWAISTKISRIRGKINNQLSPVLLLPLILLRSWLGKKHKPNLIKIAK